MSLPTSPVPLTWRSASWRGVNLRPRLFAWLALASFVGMTIVLLATGRAGLLRLAFPGGAGVLGLILLLFHPELYLGTVWWLWFLTPLVRRLVDLQTGWDATNPVLLAPLAATAACLWEVFRHLPTLRRRRLAPFAVVFAGVAYGYPLGVWNAGIAAATYGTLLWLAPISLGFHLALHVERYQAYSRVTRRVFGWGVFVMGVYGLWQFFAPQDWDQYWMVNSQMGTIGRPEPMLVRIFSTMNSPQPFAMVMLPGLLLLLAQRGPIHWVAGVPGYAAFVLSQVRTAWLSWLIGFLAFAMYIRGRARRRLLAILTAPVALMAAALAFEPVQARLFERTESLTELSQDRSFQRRVNLHHMFTEFVFKRPLGSGIGATGASTQLSSTGEEQIRVVDSGLLDICLSLGVPGGLAFLGSITVLLLRILRPREGVTDDVARSCRASALAIFAAILSLNTVVGGIGAAFWHCLGLALAAQAQPGTLQDRGPGRLANIPASRSGRPPHTVAGSAARPAVSA